MVEGHIVPPPASPLAGAMVGSGPDVAIGESAIGELAIGELAIEELALASLVQVAVWPGQNGAAARALADGGWPAMPEPRHSTVSADGETVALDSGPGRFLIEGDANICDRLLAAIPSSVGTVSDLTHSRTRFRLSGRRAAWVLAKGTSVDLRDAAFPVGAVAWTSVHGMGIIVRRVDADAYDAMPYRGFARAFAEWLEEAARADGR